MSDAKNGGKILWQAIHSILNVIAADGAINVDFQDVQKILGKAGLVFVGTGHASGAERHLVAAKAAIDDLRRESGGIDDVSGILVCITVSREVKVVEINKAMDYIAKAANPQAFIRYGQTFDEDSGGVFGVTVFIRKNI